MSARDDSIEISFNAIRQHWLELLLSTPGFALILFGVIQEKQIPGTVGFALVSFALLIHVFRTIAADISQPLQKERPPVIGKSRFSRKHQPEKPKQQPVRASTDSREFDSAMIEQYISGGRARRMQRDQHNSVEAIPAMTDEPPN